MSQHCAIQEFLDQDVNLVVSLHTHRYGGGIVAMVCRHDRVEDFVDNVEDNNGETEWELWGMRDSWYPIVEGEGISDALNRLRAKLVAEKEDWTAIITGISIVPRFPSRAEGRVKCKVVTVEQLRIAHTAWNLGAEPSVLF